MFKSATFKLTMWYLAIVMVISVAFSFAIYRFATNELTLGLHSQTRRIFEQYPVFNTDPFLQRQGDDVSQGAHHILLQLTYFNILVLAGAGFASYWLARRTLEPIEAAHDRQKRFTSDVSHELRTPLTSLKMGSEVALMDKQADKKELRGALESNLEDAAQMEMLINNLLRLTKLDAGEAQMQFTRVNIQQPLQAAIDRLQRQANSKHIAITNTVQEATISGDNDVLTQLFVILLDNAIKYSPDKSSVEIVSEAKEGAVHITITDQGQGIEPAALPHVFDRFYRADAARVKQEDSEGFGLGLSIAKLIADRHNGAITLTSRPGKGTTATVIFPLSS